MPLELTLITWLKNRYLSHSHTGGEGATVAHNALSGLTTGDDHTQYRLESADHNHESTGLQAGQLDHGATMVAASLLDDDHTQYRLESENHTHRSSGLQGGLLTDVLDNIVTFEDTVVVFEGKIVYT